MSFGLPQGSALGRLVHAFTILPGGPYCSSLPLSAPPVFGSWLLWYQRWKLNWHERVFSYCAPYLWKSLPPVIREADPAEKCESNLKTHLFTVAGLGLTLLLIGSKWAGRTDPPLCVPSQHFFLPNSLFLPCRAYVIKWAGYRGQWERQTGGGWWARPSLFQTPGRSAQRPPAPGGSWGAQTSWRGRRAGQTLAHCRFSPDERTQNW